MSELIQQEQLKTSLEEYLNNSSISEILKQTAFSLYERNRPVDFIKLFLLCAEYGRRCQERVEEYKDLQGLFVVVGNEKKINKIINGKHPISEVMKNVIDGYGNFILREREFEEIEETLFLNYEKKGIDGAYVFSDENNAYKLLRINQLFPSTNIFYDKIPRWLIKRLKDEKNLPPEASFLGAKTTVALDLTTKYGFLTITTSGKDGRPEIRGKTRVFHPGKEGILDIVYDPYEKTVYEVGHHGESYVINSAEMHHNGF